MLRLPRERRERARIASGRTHDSPCVFRPQADRSEQQGNQKKILRRNPKPASKFSNTLQKAHSDLKLPTHSFQNRQFGPKKAKRLPHDVRGAASMPGWKLVL